MGCMVGDRRLVVRRGSAVVLLGRSDETSKLTLPSRLPWLARYCLVIGLARSGSASLGIAWLGFAS
eukprot:1605389-Alexandrium_andersonii.AAC.1